MIFITCILFCCTQVMTPELEWSKADEVALQSAQKRCKELYKASKCLIKFKKMEPQVYRATCGQENNYD